LNVCLFVLPQAFVKGLKELPLYFTSSPYQAPYYCPSVPQTPVLPPKLQLPPVAMHSSSSLAKNIFRCVSCNERVQEGNFLPTARINHYIKYHAPAGYNESSMNFPMLLSQFSLEAPDSVVPKLSFTALPSKSTMQAKRAFKCMQCNAVRPVGDAWHWCDECAMDESPEFRLCSIRCKKKHESNYSCSNCGEVYCERGSHLCDKGGDEDDEEEEEEEEEAATSSDDESRDWKPEDDEKIKDEKVIAVIESSDEALSEEDDGPTEPKRLSADEVINRAGVSRYVDTCDEASEEEEIEASSEEIGEEDEEDDDDEDDEGMPVSSTQASIVSSRESSSIVEVEPLDPEDPANVAVVEKFNEKARVGEKRRRDPDPDMHGICTKTPECIAKQRVLAVDDMCAQCVRYHMTMLRGFVMDSVADVTKGAKKV
jgi:hypothetical protein